MYLPAGTACPAGTDVQGYIALAGAGRYEDAYRLIRQSNPFPSVCGRICNHPCQAACNRNDLDESVGIRDIKRFVADKAFENGMPVVEKKRKSQRKENCRYRRRPQRPELCILPAAEWLFR